MSGPGTQLRVLIVDDNPGDVGLVRNALRKAANLATVEHVFRAEDAMRRLADTDGLPPQLVFLDLQLPGASGLALLRRLRASARHKAMPVVILSSSSSQEDINAAYDAGANAYLVKDVNAKALIERLRSAVLFWRDVAALPTGDDG